MPWQPWKTLCSPNCQKLFINRHKFTKYKVWLTEAHIFCPVKITGIYGLASFIEVWDLPYWQYRKRFVEWLLFEMQWNQVYSHSHFYIALADEFFDNIHQMTSEWHENQQKTQSSKLCIRGVAKVYFKKMIHNLFIFRGFKNKFSYKFAISF